MRAEIHNQEANSSIFPEKNELFLIISLNSAVIQYFALAQNSFFIVTSLYSSEKRA